MNEDKLIDSSPDDEELLRTMKMRIVKSYRWQEDIITVLSMSDIVCLPSYREGLPKVLIEACSCSRPIVTTDVPGCRDTIEFDPTSPGSEIIEYKNNKIKKGSNGLLVPARNPDALAAAIFYLIENPDERNRMGLRSREIASSKFDVRKINAKMREYLGY